MNASQQLPLFDVRDDGFIYDYDSSSNHEFSDFVVYVDESGDHNLVTIDKDYPVFVLAFMVFHKRYYAEKVVTAVEKFKFNHFGHDLIVLHENEIRKQKNQFVVLTNKAKREFFLDELSRIISNSNFVLIACVIDKLSLTHSPLIISNDNPYHMALSHCLESLYDFMSEKEQTHRKTHIVVECRGKKEDQELELEFRRICDGNNVHSKAYPFDVVFADKRANSTGLQLADLVARPIGIKTIRPDQVNRAFEVLKGKFFCRGGRKQLGLDYEGYGLKIISSSPKKRKAPMNPPKL